MSIIAYTANLQHGQGTDGSFNFSRQVTAFASGDLIAVQERSGSETGWDGPLASGGYTQAVYRPNQIGGSDGNAIWYKSSKVSNLQTYQVQLSEGATSPWDGIPTNVDKSAVGMKCLSEGKQFYFVSTHLCQNAGADSNGSLFSAIRDGQVDTLLAWIASDLTGLDVLLFGDMNFAPNYLRGTGYQIDAFLNAGFIELWRLGINDGKAIANWGDRDGNGSPDMPIGDLSSGTHDAMRRIDHCYYKPVNRVLSLKRIEYPDLRATCSGALTGSPLRCPDVASDQLTGTAFDYGSMPADHVWIEVEMETQGPRKKQIGLTI